MYISSNTLLSYSLLVNVVNVRATMLVYEGVTHIASDVQTQLECSGTGPAYMALLVFNLFLGMRAM